MNNKVILGDNMEYMKTVPDNYFELAVVDPPYGIKDHIINGGESKKKIKIRTELAKWDVKPPKEYWKELFRISKNQIIWGANYFTEEIEFSRGWIVWDKMQPEGIRLSKAELAYTSFNVNCEIYRFRTASQKKIHACQKPVALYKWILKNYAKPNDKIFDSHVGSGSIRIACHDMGFDFTGCEIDEDYYNDQEERFKKHTMQGDLFSGADLQGSMFDNNP